MLIFCLFRCIRIHIYCFFLCVLSCNFPLLPRSTQSLCRHHCLKIIILPYNVWACKNKRQVFSVFVFAFVNKCGKILILIFFSFVTFILKKKLTVLWIGEASGLSQKCCIEYCTLSLWEYEIQITLDLKGGICMPILRWWDGMF